MAQIVSVASGKGGVGKSVLVSNLGVLAARSGLRTVLCDLDVGGADLHVLFGQFHGPTLSDFISHRVASLEQVMQPVPICGRLALLAGTGETLATANPAFATKRRLVRHLQKLPADLILIDVGAGTNYHALDFFLAADVQIVVGVPEPTSVFDIYGFLKLALIRRLVTLLLSRHRVSVAAVRRDFSSVDDVIDLAAAIAPHAVATVQEALSAFVPKLLVNKVTRGATVDSRHLRRVLKQFLKSDLTLLGEIPRDPRVAQSVQKFLPVVELDPAAPATRALHSVAQKLWQPASQPAEPWPQTIEPQPGPL